MDLRDDRHSLAALRSTQWLNAILLEDPRCSVQGVKERAFTTGTLSVGPGSTSRCDAIHVTGLDLFSLYPSSVNQAFFPSRVFQRARRLRKIVHNVRDRKGTPGRLGKAVGVARQAFCSVSSYLPCG